MARHDYRVQRGRILKVLYKPYPDGVSDRIISLSLNDIRLPASSGILRGHCNYLADRGLVRIEEIKDPDEGSRIEFIARLTAAGVDFVEKDSSDDGIELGV